MAKVTLTFRIDEDLKCRLGETAKTQHRTSGNLVEWLIKQYLDQVAKRPSSPPQELEFASPDDLHSILSQRRPALVDTLQYLEDK
ncbi:hypothetical protein SAMN02745130_03113 [Thiothrix eikelboomii]|uniref:Uncharacterized protein n=1 Tax=Thiothrix eikelboomii TaxID=92487 RepID=A0A1T4XL39_9GAMM|nr:hypothetical protein [Thiothrix eikelboomii]SKA90216.1 hypothetical protein SAMN02745130_03113 [Thiothrix eikelboomii]